MGEGCCQESQTMVFEIRLASSPLKIFESLFFSTSVIFKAFFDEYFVVKSHSQFLRLIEEFNDASKTGPTIQNPLTLNGDIGIFLGQGIHPM
jgi:hypothetical protein